MNEIGCIEGSIALVLERSRHSPLLDRRAVFQQEFDQLLISCFSKPVIPIQLSWPPQWLQF